MENLMHKEWNQSELQFVSKAKRPACLIWLPYWSADKHFQGVSSEKGHENYNGTKYATHIKKMFIHYIPTATN